MTDIIFEAVSMGVDSIISGAIVVMLVSILNLSAQLNSYASMQETYAQSLTYYRQYSKYNAEEVVAADVITALFYYDGGIDLYIVDVSVDDPSNMYAKLYKKENNKIVVYQPSLTINGANTAYILKDVSTGTAISVPIANKSSIASALYEAVAKTNKITTHTEDLSLTTVSGELKADSIFTSYLLEDLSTTPSAQYSGGTVTGILMLKKLD